ncbi:hypothetical protein RYZ27_09880 [Hyphomonas sp. FCG-A18]|uniref:hypothetical protein n=1 Tax=Hyphomonas sp. FCG-A18 TaxID=3080019 RepID=UPI002B2FB2EE|nr:hypothetical protein RYZ27_09880 [Hyphomonas sp. FCG-A18]
MALKAGFYLGGLALTATLYPNAQAQNTSGVFGPMVNEGERGWEYRATYDADSEELNQRIHYQQAINGDLRWRVLAQVRETADSDYDPDYIRGELVWQITPDKQTYQSGFRFEARYRFEDRPGDVTVHWINQWKPVDDWTLRFILGATQQIGNDPADGLLIQTRTGAYTSLDSGLRLGLEAYSQYGSTSDWLSTDEQEHQIGPYAIWPLTDEWSLFTGALFGATEATPDNELRLRLTRYF